MLAHTQANTQARTATLTLALLLVSVLLMLLGAGIGSTGASALWRAWDDPLSARILWDIRLPRSLGAWAAGGLLGLSGAIAQGLFRNPLADPYLLGSASGAAAGVAVALTLTGVSPLAMPWFTRLGLTGAAFAGATLSVLLTLILARGVGHTLRLLLAGVVVGVVLGALTSLIGLMSPDILPAMQAFMLGSTGFVGWPACIIMLAVLALTLLCALAMSRLLDGLSLGEATALSLGLPLKPMRIALVLSLCLATGTAVAQTGLIAFVGLAAPHVVRGLIKARHGTLLWLSTVMGAVLLSAADLLARLAIAPQELPVGLLTALLGGGYLLWLMYRAQRLNNHGSPRQGPHIDKSTAQGDL